MAASPHRPSLRAHILTSTLAMARGGEAISLETAARATGLTKPGLMYHFPTKAALMTALTDHVIDGYETELRKRLPADIATGVQGSVEQRLGAYVDWACGGDFDASDLVMFSDPRLRGELTAQWCARVEPWLHVPARLPAARRARLLAARLIADGAWFAAASGALPLTAAERRAVRAEAHQLLAETR